MHDASLAFLALHDFLLSFCSRFLLAALGIFFPIGFGAQASDLRFLFFGELFPSSEATAPPELDGGLVFHFSPLGHLAGFYPPSSSQCNLAQSPNIGRLAVSVKPKMAPLAGAGP